MDNTVFKNIDKLEENNFIQENKSLLKEEYGDESDENLIDVFSLSDFLFKKEDNYLKVLIYSRYYHQMKIDKVIFDKIYIDLFKNFLNKINDVYYVHVYIKEDRIGDYIPKEYYTKEIIENIFSYFTYQNAIKYLINQNCENFASIIKHVLLEINGYYLLEYINSNIEGYFDLCKSIIEKHPISISYVHDSYEKYYDLCKFALSTTNNSQLIKYISKEYITEELCYIAVSKNPNAFVYMPSKFQTYELFKFAYSKDNYILINYAFDKEYISQLKSDFPQDKYFIEKYQLKEYISKENKSLLKEEILLNQESFNYKSDRNKIDINSLNNFLLDKGDNFLDILLYVKGYKEIDYYSVFFKNDIIKYIYPMDLRKVPKELWEDYSFCLLVSEKNPYTVEFIDEKYLEDYNIIKNILKQKGEFINKFNPDVLDDKLIRLANKTNDSGKDLTDTCYDWNFFPDRYKLLKKIISVYPDKIRFINANEYKYPIDNKYYELFKIAYLKNKNILRYNKVIKHWVYYERLKKEIENESSLKEYISKEVKFLLRECLLKKKSPLL